MCMKLYDDFGMSNPFFFSVGMEREMLKMARR